MEVKLRPIQTSILNRIRKAIAEGKTDIFINAPTGTGKSLVGLDISQDFDSYLLTSEKTLQSQYEEETIKYSIHKPVKSICGMDTYKCNVNGEKFSLGVCKMMGKSNREALQMDCASTCEYLQRWKAAKDAKRSILNYSYYLIQQNYVLQNISDAPFRERTLVICDEAHKLPDIIENHFACTVDSKFIQKTRSLLTILRSAGVLNHTIEYHGIEFAILQVLSEKKESSTKTHLRNLEILFDEYTILQESVDSLKEVFSEKYIKKSSNSTELKKKLKYLPKEVRTTFAFSDNLKDRCCKIEDYIKIIKESSLDNLIADNVEDGKRSFHSLDDSYLFKQHFSKFSKIRIYMSATLQGDLLIKRFGIDPKDALVLNVDSVWDKRRSPIVLCNTANLTYKNQEHGLASCIKKIDSLLKKHKGERGLIHTTSNSIMNRVVENSLYRDRLYCYNGTEEKMDILSEFHKFPRDAVLIGPSLTTGLDMKDDLARFNIIIKLSFPNMTSALWAKRYEVANHIYIGETASILEQSCGRTTRSKDDYSISYILDSRANWFINGNKSLFSPSFLDRIVKKSP